MNTSFPRPLLEAVSIWMDYTGTSSLTVDRSGNKVTLKYTAFDRRVVDVPSDPVLTK